MTKINLSHKIDYTKEDIVLVTRNGVMHDKTGGTRSLSEHYIKIEQQGGAGFVDYEFHEEFVSANCYEISPGRAVYRVCDFKNSDVNIIKSEYQFRLYKNKRYAFIRKSDNGYEISTDPYSGYIPVKTEEEVSQKAFALTECKCRKIKNTIKKWYWDISDPYIQYTTALTVTSFSNKTMQTMEEFLGFNKPENKSLLGLYKSRYETRLKDLGCVLDYMRLNENMVKRHDAVQNEGTAYYEMFREAANKLLQEGASTSVSMWKRVNDEIVVYSHNSWCECIYICNTKSKKQKIFKHKDGNFKRLMFTRYNVKSIYEYIDNVMLLSPAKEIFKGTNIEYIINNDIKEIGIIKAGCYEEDRFLPIVEEIKDNKINIKAAILLLLLSGNKVAELLLKAKLYNIFMVLLEGRYDHIIAIQSKSSYADIEYIFKNTLQDSFNMNLSQLRILNERLALQWKMENHSVFNPQTREWDQAPLMRCSYEPCGVRLCRKVVGDNLRCIDNDLFNRILDLSNIPNMNLTDRLIEEIRLATPNHTITQRLKIIEEANIYSSYTYRDYLSMRRQLKEAMEKHGTTFDDRKYPIQPGKAIRYMAFRPGIIRIGYNRPGTVEEFYDSLNEVYSSEQIEKVKEGEEYGAIIHMMPYQNLNYLHNEIQILLSAYTNAHKNEEFAEAVKRVKPLEYSDKETGLQIVSPKSVEDLINEGKVLSHCVGSYVDAIIENKSNIMFIRRSDMPDFPYYTVEIVDNKIRQIHCYGNGDPTEAGQEYAYKGSKYSVYSKKFNIIQFITNWAKKNGKITISSIKEYYGALCHM